MCFKIDWASLIVGRKFTLFALFYFVFEGNFQVQAPGGAYIWRGDLTEVFLRYKLGGFIFGGGGGGLIHGGAYFRNFTVCLKTIKILLISNSCIMLSIDITQWRNVFRGKGVTLPSTPSERLYEKKIDPFAHANKWRWAAQQK